MYDEVGNKIKSPRKAEIKVVLTTKEQKMSVLTTFRKCFAHGIFFLSKVVKVKNLRCTDQKHFAQCYMGRLHRRHTQF